MERTSIIIAIREDSLPYSYCNHLTYIVKIDQKNINTSFLRVYLKERMLFIMEKSKRIRQLLRKEENMVEKENKLIKYYCWGILIVMLSIIIKLNDNYEKMIVECLNGRTDQLHNIRDNDFTISRSTNELILKLLSNISIEEENIYTEEEVLIIDGAEEETIDENIGEPIAEVLGEAIPEPEYFPYDESLYGLNLGELFSYMDKVGEENNIPPEILQAMAKIESEFNPNAISLSNDHGLMQINACNFSTLRKMGISNFYDPYQSVDAAIIIINLIRDNCSSSKGNSWHYILMSYNMGQANANKRWKQGQYSSSYSREVLNEAKKRGWIE